MIINTEKIIADLSDNIVMRSNEIYLYDLNIDNYEHIVATYTSDYPDHMEYLVGVSPSDAVANCLPEHLEELAQIIQCRNASNILKTEIIERTKCQMILDTLVSKLHNITTDEEYDAAIAAAVARRG
jgi:hypothetical protein